MPTPAFQSTLPVWGATVEEVRGIVQMIISIHAPRVGSDLRGASERADGGYFNPRSPCGERLANASQRLL